jgi:hypothetical protein
MNALFTANPSAVKRLNVSKAMLLDKAAFYVIDNSGS